MKKLLLILLCLPMIGFGQNVYIPDANFKAYLVGTTWINTNGDSHIQISEATSFPGYIDCEALNIYDLTGIEAFTAITKLWCGYNLLTSFDVSQNTALIHFDCEDNQLTSLDVSNNIALEYLGCGQNDLTSIDVSQNTALTELWCGYNELTALDLSYNIALEDLDCTSNELTCLNLANGNNTNMNGSTLYANHNSNLGCIEVDDVAWSTANWEIDPQPSFSIDCNNACSGTSTGILDITNKRNLFKITDMLGQETPYRKNTPLFYIYDNGTVEKKIILE